MNANLSAAVKQRALDLGFARVGIAEATHLAREEQWLTEFVREGRHGQMDWLADTVDVRSNPAHDRMVPGALSVIVVVLPYAANTEDLLTLEPGRIARYAQGRDYHNVMTRRLRKLEKWLRQQGFDSRYSVDSRPVLERAWAERAGLGFVGKNCCFIVPGIGSHVFLGTVVTTAPLVADDAPIAEKDRCGSCTACLTQCPTRAFVAPRQLDARRCISYLTIEHEGPIDDSLASAIGTWMFGCDACQDACPHNAALALPRGPRLLEAKLVEALNPITERTQYHASDFLDMTEEQFTTWGEGTALRRPGLERTARNAAIVLGNSGDKKYLPVLQRTVTSHPEALVRDAAARAVASLEAAEEALSTKTPS